ncbi:MAG: folate-binding protein [Cyanobacteria bacterium P01_D01_bin.36]
MALAPNTVINTILTAQPAVFDRSHWSRIRLTGADRVRFLHNQTTNNIEQLAEGQGCYTVFVTSTGRTLDLASVYALPDSLLLTLSPEMGKPLYDWMDRYIFFSDKVTLTDESEQLFLFTVLGENADVIASSLGAESLIGQPLFTHTSVALPNSELETADTIHVAVGTDLAMPGYTLWGPKAHSEAVWQALCDAGASVHTAQQWEQLRIQQGRPMPGYELTDADNPLEAGLWRSVSFEKGCYIGQETIARLNTYQGVKKRLWGLVLENDVPTDVLVNMPVTVEGTKIGKITSLAHSESGTFGLAYIRTKAGGEKLTVDLGDTSAQVTGLPFVLHEYYTPETK